MQYEVKSTALNLRSAPVVAPSNRLVTLSQGQIVTVVGPSTAAGWVIVDATVNGVVYRGHVNQTYLQIPGAAPPAPLQLPIPPAVHMPNASGRRNNQNSGMASRLGDAGIPPPRNPAAPPAGRIASLHTNIAWLDSPVSARYAPRAGVTYCNIYAYDYACLAGVYLPRVWWMDKALGQIAAGAPAPAVQYGVTVDELNANSLHDWFAEWGDDFGWRRMPDPTQAQTAANNGEAVIAVAKRKDLARSGHITAIVPETGAPSGVAAVRSGEMVVKPLMSQAGATNYRYVASNFYLMDQFQSFGLWAHA